MKAVVFITGTNAVGKSTIANAIIDHFGGIGEERGCMTFLKNSRYGLVGRYKNSRYGGVDGLKNEKGSSCTSKLADAVHEGLQVADVVFCEGSFMNTFGLNLIRALFLGDKALIVNLYAPPKVLYERLIARSKGSTRNACNRQWASIFKKQRQSMIAARKYEQIGCKVLQYDTSQYTAEQIMDELLKTLEGMQDVE